jgi:hypothetical protein
MASNTIIPPNGVITLTADVVNANATMSNITGLTLTLGVGWYELEFIPYFSVIANTQGIGFDFGSGTATLTDYTFNGIFPSGISANQFINTAVRINNVTTTTTINPLNNRAIIYVSFRVTVAGTIIPRFRSETVTANAVTLKIMSTIKYKKVG